MPKNQPNCFKKFLVFTIGNLWRATFQALFNSLRYIYYWYKLFREFGIFESFNQYKLFKLKTLETIWEPIYEYDGIGEGLFQKFPTYTKCLSDFAHDSFHGNCMDFAHCAKQRFKTRAYGTKRKLRIMMVGMNVAKVHYLLEVTVNGKVITYHLVKSGEKVEELTARQIMERNHPDKNIYRIW